MTLIKGACMLYLSWALNAFHHDKENGYPRQQETYYDPPPGYSRIFDARGSIQGGAVPEVRRLRRTFAFRRYRVVYYWTVRPRQRTLQQEKNTLQRIPRSLIKQSEIAITDMFTNGLSFVVVFLLIFDVVLNQNSDSVCHFRQVNWSAQQFSTCFFKLIFYGSRLNILCLFCNLRKVLRPKLLAKRNLH